MRHLLAILCLLLAAATSFAADIEPAVQQLDTDLAARVAAIARRSAPESKELTNARKQLARYKARNDVADFKVLTAAERFVVASRTQDAAVLAAARALVDAMLDRVARRLGFIDDARNVLIDPLHLAALERALDIPDGILDRGRALLDADLGRAAAFITKAYDLYGLVLARAWKMGEAEQGSPPPDGLTYTASSVAVDLQNTAARPYDITKIRVFAAVSSGGNVVQTYVGDDLKTLFPDLFAVRRSNRIEAGDVAPVTYPLRPILDRLIPPMLASPRLTGFAQVTVKGFPFFLVYFDLQLP